MAQFDWVTDVEISDEEEWYFVEVDDGAEKSEGYTESLHEHGSTSSDNGDEYPKELPEEPMPPPSPFEDPIKQDILPHLPAKALMRFRAVSKTWDLWIRSPVLAHRQAYTHKPISGFFFQPIYSDPYFFSLNPAACGVPTSPLSFLPVPTHVVSSTHGLLVCRAHSWPDSYYICNPATRTFRELPRPGLYHGPDSSCVLAFDPSLANIESYYKLACAVPLVGQPVVCFETYSSETGSWACSDAICPEAGSDGFSGSGLYMKGVAYWKTEGGKVIGFDLRTERCGVLALPDGSPARGELVEMEGELGYVGISEANGGGGFVVEMYYGVEMRLGRRVEWFLEPGGLLGGCYYGVLPYCEEGRLMVVVGGGVVYSWRRGEEGFEKVGGCGRRGELGECTRFFSYVNSLVHVG